MCSRPAAWCSDGDGGDVKACVVIPIFDHKDTIEDVIAGLRYLDLPCLIVDDGSGHDTRDVLDRLPKQFPWVEVLHLSVNRGRGAALQHGYRTAARRGFSHVLQLDADGQHDTADTAKLLAAARRHPDALVLGEPVFDGTAPKSRRYGRRLSQMIVWCYTASLAIHDPLCGFRCFPLESTLRVMENHRLGDRMDFDPEIVVRLAWYGVPIVNVLTRVRYFPAGLSHFRFFRDNVLIAAAYGRLFYAVLTGTRNKCRSRMMSENSWLSIPERGTLLGMRFIVWCYRVFGRRLCSCLLIFIAGYFFVTGKAARQASRRYLARLHVWSRGRGTLDHPPRLMDSFRHFHEFSRNILDRVSFFVGDAANFEMIVHGQEHLDQLAEDRRGAIVLSAHLGSFDALRVLADQAGVAVNVVMFLRNAQMINTVFRRLNPDLYMRIINLDPTSPQAIFDIRACVQRGELVGTLGDRIGVTDSSRISRVPFLGLPARFPHGPFLLAAALKCPVFLMIGLRVRDMTYEVFVEPLAAQVDLPNSERTNRLDELVTTFARRLEAYCLRAPYQWFNFYDFWSDPGVSAT